MPNSDVNDEMLWLQSPSRIIAVANCEKSQVGISIGQFYDIYYKIYRFYLTKGACVAKM